MRADAKRPKPHFPLALVLGLCVLLAIVIWPTTWPAPDPGDVTAAPLAAESPPPTSPITSGQSPPPGTEPSPQTDLSGRAAEPAELFCAFTGRLLDTLGNPLVNFKMHVLPMAMLHGSANPAKNRLVVAFSDRVGAFDARLPQSWEHQILALSVLSPDPESAWVEHLLVQAGTGLHLVLHGPATDERHIHGSLRIAGLDGGRWVLSASGDRGLLATAIITAGLADLASTPLRCTRSQLADLPLTLWIYGDGDSPCASLPFANLQDLEQRLAAHAPLPTAPRTLHLPPLTGAAAPAQAEVGFLDAPPGTGFIMRARPNADGQIGLRCAEGTRLAIRGSMAKDPMSASGICVVDTRDVYRVAWLQTLPGPHSLTVVFHPTDFQPRGSLRLRLSPSSNQPPGPSQLVSLAIERRIDRQEDGDWTPATIHGLPPGAYTVTVVDRGSLTTDVSATVAVVPGPVHHVALVPSPVAFLAPVDAARLGPIRSIDLCVRPAGSQAPFRHIRLTTHPAHGLASFFVTALPEGAYEFEARTGSSFAIGTFSLLPVSAPQEIAATFRHGTQRRYDLGEALVGGTIRMADAPAAIPWLHWSVDQTQGTIDVPEHHAGRPLTVQRPGSDELIPLAVRADGVFAPGATNGR